MSCNVTEMVILIGQLVIRNLAFMRDEFPLSRIYSTFPKQTVIII